MWTSFSACPHQIMEFLISGGHFGIEVEAKCSDGHFVHKYYVLVIFVMLLKNTFQTHVIRDDTTRLSPSLQETNCLIRDISNRHSVHSTSDSIV